MNELVELPTIGYGLRDFKRHEVYEIVVVEGEGTSADPVRAVTYWVTEDARLIARHDPMTLLRPAREAT